MVPALPATGGEPPLPLDDVFIHFDYARAAAAGSPGSWIAGQGFSSGETSPLYAAVLAIAVLLGAKGTGLGVVAEGVAAVSLLAALGAVRAFARTPVAWCTGAALLVGLGTLGWSFWSGMESALFVGLLFHTLARLRRSRTAPTRSDAVVVAALFVALVLTRPESPVLVVPFAVYFARGSHTPFRTFARVVIPAAVASFAVLATNRVFTGTWSSAGAQLKLVTHDPHLDAFGKSREVVVNVAHFVVKVGVLGTSPWPAFAWLAPCLALSGTFARRTRGFTSTVLVAAVAWTATVSLNGAARYHAFRYYVPAVALGVAACAAAVSAWEARTRGRWVGRAAAVATVSLAWIAASRDVAFFRDASGNVHDQQVAMGRHLASHSDPADVVLVGDAGAIPYFSGLHAVDALGLGGYRRMPFVRAARLGEAATAELLERLPRSERPTWLALYPNWFPLLTRTFGSEVFRISLAHNVICGGVHKVLYRADWSRFESEDDSRSLAGEPRGSTDALDVGDVLSEDDHGYVGPDVGKSAVLGDVRVLRLASHSAERFDAGRVVPEGLSERFRYAGARGIADARIHVRTDRIDRSSEVQVVTSKSGRGILLAPDGTADEGAASEGAERPWRDLSACIGPVDPSDAIELRAVRGSYRDFHVHVADDPGCRPNSP
ncbi:MAG: hypothetical protein U0169_03880 [Polyangiaceae bacterium]